MDDAPPDPHPLRGLLRAARRHLEEGAPAAAIEALLVAWRGRRAPALADLIDRVSERHAIKLDGRTLKERMAMWDARDVAGLAPDAAGLVRDADLGTLLAALGEGPGTYRRKQLER